MILFKRLKSWWNGTAYLDYPVKPEKVSHDRVRTVYQNQFYKVRVFPSDPFTFHVFNRQTRYYEGKHPTMDKAIKQADLLGQLFRDGYYISYAKR